MLVRVKPAHPHDQQSLIHRVGRCGTAEPGPSVGRCGRGEMKCVVRSVVGWWCGIIIIIVPRHRHHFDTGMVFLVVVTVVVRLLWRIVVCAVGEHFQRFPERLRPA